MFWVLIETVLLSTDNMIWLGNMKNNFCYALKAWKLTEKFLKEH